MTLHNFKLTAKLTNINFIKTRDLQFETNDSLKIV